MKILMAAGAALSLAALPAFAGSITVQFVAADGTTSIVVFDEDNDMATMDGADPIPYTMDQDTRTVCGHTPDGDLCATFDEIGDEVGFSTGYTNTEGVTGTATITAMD